MFQGAWKSDGSTAGAGLAACTWGPSERTGDALAVCVCRRYTVFGYTDCSSQLIMRGFLPLLFLGKCGHFIEHRSPGTWQHCARCCARGESLCMVTGCPSCHSDWRLCSLAWAVCVSVLACGFGGEARDTRGHLTRVCQSCLSAVAVSDHATHSSSRERVGFLGTFLPDHIARPAPCRKEGLWQIRARARLSCCHISSPLQVRKERPARPMSAGPEEAAPALSAEHLFCTWAAAFSLGSAPDSPGGRARFQCFCPS